jgi:hypothetical protein
MSALPSIADESANKSVCLRFALLNASQYDCIFELPLPNLVLIVTPQLIVWQVLK